MKSLVRDFTFVDPKLGYRETTVAPRPEQVRAYLQAKGWRLRKEIEHFARLEKGKNAVNCPRLYRAIDYPEQLALLVEALGRIEARPCATIVRAMHRAVPTDTRQTSLLEPAKRGAA